MIIALYTDMDNGCSEKDNNQGLIPSWRGYELVLGLCILFLELSGQDMAFAGIKFHLADADG